MKLPPASRKALYTFCASSLAAPQPQSSPKVIVPRAISDTLSPEFPSSLYFISLLSQFGFLPRDGGATNIIPMCSRAFTAVNPSLNTHRRSASSESTAHGSTPVTRRRPLLGGFEFSCDGALLVLRHKSRQVAHDSARMRRKRANAIRLTAFVERDGKQRIRGF